jgi:hypothetical protein
MFWQNLLDTPARASYTQRHKKQALINSVILPLNEKYQRGELTILRWYNVVEDG